MAPSREYPYQDGDVTVLGPETFASNDGAVISWKGDNYVPQKRLRLAHQARRAKEHQLDDIRRALCDIGLMEDDDPYSHADLADVIRQSGRALAVDLTAPDVGAAKRAEEYEQERNQVMAVLAEVLRHFTEQGHPGEPCVRTPWIRTNTVNRWRSVVQHDVEQPWWQQLDTAREAVDRVRALHHDWDADPGHCAHCQDGTGTPLRWPCPTIRALDGNLLKEGA